MNAFFVVLLACKSVDRGTLFAWTAERFIQKMCLGPRFYTSIKLPKKMHSILIITFKSHQNVIYPGSWIFRCECYLFVLDYLLLEITTPLIVYIWRRHGGTCKFGFEFYWDVKHLFYNHVTYCNISMKNGSNVIIVI